MGELSHAPSMCMHTSRMYQDIQTNRKFLVDLLVWGSLHSPNYYYRHGCYTELRTYRYVRMYVGPLHKMAALYMFPCDSQCSPLRHFA